MRRSTELMLPRVSKVADAPVGRRLRSRRSQTIAACSPALESLAPSPAPRPAPRPGLLSLVSKATTSCAF
jgi:hypothetical protein